MLIRNGGKAAGPYTPSEVRAYLAAGHLTPETPAWTEGLIDWSTTDAVLKSLEERPASIHPPEFTDVSKRVLIPEGVRGFSWGALLTGAIWAIRHQVWVGLLTVIPGLGQVVLVWLGFNGRELAWRKGHWTSVAEFKRVQRRWTWYGVIFSVLLVVGLVGLQLAGKLPTAARTPVDGPGAGNPPEAIPPGLGEPRRAEPAQPPEAEQPAAKRQALRLPMEREAFKQAIVGMKLAEVRAQMGKPVLERKLDNGALVLVYQSKTFQAGSKRPDFAVLIAFVNGVSRDVEFVKEAKR